MRGRREQGEGVARAAVIRFPFMSVSNSFDMLKAPAPGNTGRRGFFIRRPLTVLRLLLILVWNRLKSGIDLLTRAYQTCNNQELGLLVDGGIGVAGRIGAG